MKLHLKQFLLAGSIVAVFTVYIVLQNFKSDNDHDDDRPVVANVNTVTTTNVAKVPVNTNVTSNVNTNKVVTNSGQYKDGTYTGSSASSLYGDVQVQATITSGKISDVTFLAFPNDRPNSIAISNRSMPILTQEAIQAQSAQVNTVSGATDTSIAFSESLAAALNQAQ